MKTKRIATGAPIADEVPWLLTDVHLELQKQPDLFHFLDAAAAYFGGVAPDRRVRGLAMRRALTETSPAATDRRTALMLCLFLAQRCLGPASPGTRAFFRRLKAIASPMGTQGKGPPRDEAYALATTIVRRAAEQLPRHRKVDRRLGGPPHEQRKVAIWMLHDLTFDVHPNFGRLASVADEDIPKDLDELLERLRRFDRHPKGKANKLSAAAILAPWMQRANAFDHTDKRGEEAVRKAIEEGVARHVKHQRDAAKERRKAKLH